MERGRPTIKTKLYFEINKYLYSFNFDDNLNYQVTLYNINWKNLVSFDASAAIANTNDGNYYIALSDRIKDEIIGANGFDTVIMKIDSNINTFTCIGFEKINNYSKSKYSLDLKHLILIMQYWLLKQYEYMQSLYTNTVKTYV